MLFLICGFAGLGFWFPVKLVGFLGNFVLRGIGII